MSVLVPLVTVDGIDSILLTKRSIHLRNHRGEICFPGGKKDETDENSEKTALRETEEEIGIRKEDIEIWSPLKSVVRRQRDFLVTPFVGRIPENALHNLKIQQSEVQSVFSVPLEELCHVAQYTKFLAPKIKYTLPVFESKEFKITTMLQMNICIQLNEFGV
ncbi:unnamed protein product [Caenorhabditis angaria]|uniref:Nudix hydrolase domain-containing protein n=1 Tax=Caenorhabditis angaria TaxID=860376 RepID=A0A9P1ICJ4_9PELO|nr:unnamed protein product [Caenorhabditis angaria]